MELTEHLVEVITRSRMFLLKEGPDSTRTLCIFLKLSLT